MSRVKKTKKHPIFSFLLKLILKLILIIIVILGILAGVLYYKTQENGGGKRGALITLLRLSKEEVDNLKPINILLLGISEDIDSTLTDTIILCSYNPQKQEAYMLSIPRDTFVGKNKSSAKGSDKINSLYVKDPKKLLNAVKDLTGITPDYYAVVKTSALVDIVDILGSINFEVPIDMDYDDPTQDLHIHLKKGMQKIDGKKAEELLRFRHNNDGTSYPASYGDNDFGRMRTQREFIDATLKQTLVTKNIFKSKKIINSLFNNLETDFTLNDILTYVPDGIEFEISNIQNYQLQGKSEKINDIWFFICDKKESAKLIEKLK